MKANSVYSVSKRLVLLSVVSLLAGCYWNLSWFMALPFITIIGPLAISILVSRLFQNASFWQRSGVYIGAVIVAEVVRNFLYVIYGRGLDYLLYDGETQLIVLALITEQLFFGTIILGIITLLKRRRIASIIY